MVKTLKMRDIAKAKIAQKIINVGVMKGNDIIILYGKSLRDDIARKYKCLGHYVISIEQKKIYDFS